MPRDLSSAAKSSSYMRRIGDLGVAPTTTIFLKPRLAAVGSVHDEVSCVAGAHEASTATATAMLPSRTEVLNFTESLSFTRTRVNIRARPGPASRDALQARRHNAAPACSEATRRGMRPFRRGKSRSQRGAGIVDSAGCAV